MRYGLLPLALVAAPAFAHHGHGDGDGFVLGAMHPLTGPDHLLAMLLVGLWAGTAFGRRGWRPAAGFLAGMAGGFAIGMTGAAAPLAEPVVLLSIVGLVAAVAGGWRPPIAVAVGLVALFGAAHGVAHGAGLPGGGDALGFAAGALLTTAVLHGLGLAIAAAVAGRRRRQPQQWPPLP